MAIIQAIAASVLDAPLNCSFQAPLARLPLNPATWPMCPVMLVVSCMKFYVITPLIILVIYACSYYVFIRNFEYINIQKISQSGYKCIVPKTVYRRLSFMVSAADGSLIIDATGFWNVYYPIAIVDFYISTKE